MGPDGLHPKMLRELVDVVAKPLSVILQQTWLAGNVLALQRDRDRLDQWAKENV